MCQPRSSLVARRSSLRIVTLTISSVLAILMISCSDNLFEKIEADVREVYTLGDILSPVIAPTPDAPALAHTVNLNLRSDGASIRYTLDGSDPSDTAGALYNAPFSLTRSATVKALSFKKYWASSPIVSHRFSVGWAASLEESGVDVAAYGVADSGGNIYIAGSAGSTGAPSSYGTDRAAGARRVARLGLDGSVIWATGLGQIPVDGGSPIAATADGGLVLATQAEYVNYNYYTRITKLNSAGGLAWTSYCKPSAFSESVGQFAFQAIRALPDGRIALAGTEYEDMRASYNLFLTIMASDGSPAEAYGLGGGLGSAKASGLAYISAGGAPTAFAITGYGFAESGSTGVDGFAIFLTGQKARSSALSLKMTSGTNEDALTSVAASGDGFYVGGYSDHYVTSSNYNAVVAKTSATGVVAWVKEIGALAYDERIYGVVALPDGGFVAVGRRGTSSTAGGDAWVLRGNANGDILWEKAYGGFGEEAAYGVALASDGDILVAGSSSSFSSRASAFALKLNLDGAPVSSSASVWLGADRATYSTSAAGALAATSSFGSSGYSSFTSDNTATSLTAKTWTISRQYP